MSAMDTSAEAGRERFEVFVNDVPEVWDTKDVLASKMMERAGIKDTKDHILEALDGKNGTPVAEFQPNQEVDLSLPDRKFFRVTAGGGGFS
jgi:hypothetical protein